MPTAPTYTPPSYDPNAWKADPGYLMALAQQQQGNTALDAWLKQGRTSALIDFGDPNLAIPGFRLGNIAVLVQPARGYNLDPKSTYHDPALVPPHS